ncbi:MAG: PilT/PilU family type 4a pilus ATPase [Gammaproteobacteria bacterium]|nr:PilT/PilU family type 4a pilus ATPase [Gammaproteobacteria bacterium]
MNVKRLLELMAEKNASDLYFTTDAPVKIKIEGRIVPVNNVDLEHNMICEAVASIMSQDQMDKFAREKEMDFAIQEPNMGRYRVNVFRQRGDMAMVIRYITTDIPQIDELGLPTVLKDLALRRRGLVLMVGATGCGKSTSLAGMINYRNEQTANHILTIEDPIEFVHENKKSIVNQREVGVDTLSYARALRSAMREAPDVILVGEIRDSETMEAALALAGTGHLCLATLHANNSGETLDRIINLFPMDQHRQIFLDLSQYLRAIISQRLVRGIDGKRVPAVEVMLNTPHISEQILKGDVSSVKEAMDESTAEGMQTFDDSLFDLHHSGRIDLEEALSHADSRANLEHRISFG